PIALGALGSAVAAIGGVALAGYVLGLATTYGLWSFTRVAVHTAAGIVILGMGILAWAWRDHQVSEQGPPPWLPFPVGLTVLAASLVLSQALVNQGRQRAEREVALVAAGLGDEIQTRMESRIRLLVQVARRWGDASNPPREQWESDASLFVSSFPIYQAIEWIDPSFHVRWHEPHEGNEADENLDLGFEQRRRTALEQARDGREVTITQSIDLVQGGKGFRVNVPMFRGQKCQGFIGGVFQIGKVMQAVLQQGASPGYQISLLEDGQEVYRSSAHSAMLGPEWGREAAIHLPGVTWAVRARPAAELLAQVVSPLPEVVLAAGLLLAALLGWAVHLALTARQQAAATGAANRELQLEIGQRRQAQEALAKQSAILTSVLNHMGDGVVVADEQGRCVVSNPAAERIIGVELSDVPPAEWSQYYGLYQSDRATPLPPEELPLARSIGGAAVDAQEIFVRNTARPDGAWISVTSRPLPGPSGAPKAGVAVFRDITPGRLAEHEIRQLNAELERRVTERTAQLQDAVDQLEGFSYSVSHDLRAPLRAIHGFSSALLEDYAPKLEAGAQGYLHSIANAAQRMGQLIDDLLAFSRLGRKPIQSTRIDMAELARSVFEDLRLAAPERNLQCVIHPLPPAWGDPAMIRQVLVNLLANAIKFTKTRDPARIEVGGSNGGAGNTYHVTDNGAGFDMRYATKLFGVFQRLHTLAEFDGTGVGLAIVQRIVRRHGGQVWAEGKINEGAAFHFTLPPEDPSAASQ
ncbi:MAG TPA: ATP-binding protein, partial [Bryobacterales bacterium]|nr:ATP-binding protein [Bryobacterales bacterium]